MVNLNLYNHLLKSIKECMDIINGLIKYIEVLKEEKNGIIWHDPREIPKKDNTKILIFTKFHDIYIERLPTCLRGCKLTYYRWEEFVNEKGVISWTYLSNILPTLYLNNKNLLQNGQK